MSCNTPSNTPSARHLDSIYRRRWELYMTPNAVYDSREVNWKDIPRNEVTRLEAHVNGCHYLVEPGDGFQSFIKWRWGGQEWIDGKLYKINKWCIGYHNGTTCFMKEIEFKDGSMIEKEYPLEEFKNHLGE